MFDHCRLFVLFLIFSLVRCHVHGLSETELARSVLAQKDMDLNTLVEQVQKNHENFKNNCELLQNCSAVSGCSRLSCFKYYGASGPGDYKCHHVSNNSFCPVAVGTCQHRNFDFSQSFLRRVVDDSATEQSICAQKNLDVFFKNMSNHTHLFQVYFGASDGSFRVFPGSDEANCENSYEPRIRPWYRRSIHARKSIVVLIDTGSTMTNKIEAENGSLLDLLKGKLSTNFLTTLDEKDMIFFMTFGFNEFKQLNSAAVVESDPGVQNGNSTVDKLTKLLDAIDSKSSLKDPTETDVISAINNASDVLSTSDSQYFNVILMFTTGDNIPQNITVDASVRLFIYKLIIGPNLTSDNCTEKILIEHLKYNDFQQNAPFAMKSYFSWLGKLHRLIMNGSIDYSELHEDFNGIDSHTFTLSKPDIFKNETSNDYKFTDNTTLQNAVHDRNQTTSSSGEYDASTMTNVPSVCYKPSICPGPKSEINSLCPAKNDNQNTKVSCCGDCIARGEPNHTALIAGLVVAGAVVISFVSIWLVNFCIR
uniref:VWFA domain-containing protein n=1 Tax=Physcomitrium patens TaxID=3218 RepID=A0A2K1L0A2_PHYPA|nr:hypothetical protein PHYPA_002246 [Physcomitrium patens]